MHACCFKLSKQLGIAQVSAGILLSASAPGQGPSTPAMRTKS